LSVATSNRLPAHHSLLDLLIAAGRRLVDAVIEPSTTRHHVARVLEYLHTKRELRPQKKHGLMPL